MKDMIKRIREEREGFTLAELLIVVAIIAVLVAIAIPVFNTQLHKAQDATDEANARSLYADLQADYLASADKSYDKASWAGAPTSGTSITPGNTGNTFTLSDGQVITVKNCTVTPTFVPGKGWNVTCKCVTDGHVNDNWGVAKTTVTP